MKEYTMTVTYTVDARDYDEAVEIAKSVCATIRADSEYRVREVETSTIQEV